MANGIQIKWQTAHHNGHAARVCSIIQIETRCSPVSSLESRVGELLHHRHDLLEVVDAVLEARDHWVVRVLLALHT